MKRNQRSLISLAGSLLIIVAVLFVGQSTPSSTATAQRMGNPGLFLRLQYATFDPVIGEPPIPQQLRMTSDLSGRGVYIVQFIGPIQQSWKDALVAAGARIDLYLPDFAFVVQMDDRIRAPIEALWFVRWVGPFHPAYKMSPRLQASPFDLYRVLLAGWAAPDQVRHQLAALGVKSGGQSRWLLVNVRFDQLKQIAGWSDVLWIEPYRFFEKHNDVAAGIMNAQVPWNFNYTGNGQTVTVADTGLDTGTDNPAVNDDIHRDFDNRVAHISSWQVVPEIGCIINSGADDGPSDLNSGHGTHVAGSAAGNGARSSGLYKGPAYEATLTFQAVEQFTQWTGSCATRFGPQSYALTGLPTDLNLLFDEAYNWGSRIHTNSWGAPAAGAYAVSSQQADLFAWNYKDFAILFSAGNWGTDANSDGYADEDSMGSPGTAKNVITIGASESYRTSGGLNPGGLCSSYGTCWPSDFTADPSRSDAISDSSGELAAFSSRGPTDDGRIKPDLVGPGTNILSTRSSLISGTGWGSGPSAYYMYLGGTSMATPLAAGAVAVVRDYLVDAEGMANPSSALIKAILINSAVDLLGYGNLSQEAGQPIPNDHEGWGRIDLAAAISDTNRLMIDGPQLMTGDTHTYVFTTTNPNRPLKVTLVWTDYPGNPLSSGSQLVNDIDLVVTEPGGTTVYQGNNFSNGWSMPGGVADRFNNVENVYIQTPASGIWSIDISGFSVPQGPQPYALIVDGSGTFNTEHLFLPFVSTLRIVPKPGLWSGVANEFYVTTSSTHVDKFAVLISVDGCGTYKVTHTLPEPITNAQFSFTGSFYAYGDFSSTTVASGQDGLNSLNIPGCGLVSGGPWSWSASWQNDSQPLIMSAQIDAIGGNTILAPADFGVKRATVEVTRVD